MFVLESEQADVEPRLAQNDSLREKVSALERELLVLRGLYQRQREEARSLLARGPARQELTLLTSSLREEKEGELETSKVDKEDVNSQVFFFPFSCGEGERQVRAGGKGAQNDAEFTGRRETEGTGGEEGTATDSAACSETMPGKDQGTANTHTPHTSSSIILSFDFFRHLK